MTLAFKGLLFSLALMLTACGGGGAADTTTTPPPVAAADCVPENPDTYSECGTVFIGMTDADGDFLNYTVDILSLELETANGRLVETLPRTTRINFTDYVDLTELVTAASIPPATYVSGTIRIDYTNSEVFVEADGDSRQAVVTDDLGNVLAQTELKIHFSGHEPLRITKGKAALLQLDFDLDASHTVDIAPTPAKVVTEQFIVAEAFPVDEKDIRVRGPLVSVDEGAATYTVALRPFHDRDGDFGRVRVHVTNDTEFEVNEELFVGIDGLRALDVAGPGTPTVAAGTLDVVERKFTAHMVLAGSSVPGFHRDAVVGNVIKRDRNFLTVRGATIIPLNRRAHFHDDVVVEVGPETKVFRDGHRRRDLGIGAISIGQRVTIHGAQVGVPTTDANTPQVLFDATQGAVRMHPTRLSGIVNTIMQDQTDITLHGIDRRRVDIFDFSGSGREHGLDADPDSYEIATGNLTMAAFAAGKPIVAIGFPSAFGEAPPDFFGRTVVDFTKVRSVLGITWGAEGTFAPFVSIGPEGVVPDFSNEDIGIRHHVKQGTVLIDLTLLDSDMTIVPRKTDRTAFYIKTADSLRMYSDFGDFIGSILNSGIDGATAARSMHAVGEYNTDTNVFTAYKIGIYLLEP
jgi:hypothetical protein